MSDLLPLDAAVEIIESVLEPLDAEQVPLASAAGRVLAADALAAHDVQPFANSAMDGYAVRSSDRGDRRLAGESRAGTPSGDEVRAGEAFGISTGAAVPDGADAVVPVEQTVERDGLIEVGSEPHSGDHIRLPGEDMRKGSVAVPAGTRLGPASIGVLAAAGIERVDVRRRPRVTIVSTGDELLAPGEALGPGEIHESNGPALELACRQDGAEIAGRRLVPDAPDQIGEALEAGLGGDVLIVCGGVSVGPHDHVKGRLESLGVKRRFWRLALKPGKPTFFGTTASTAVFGLPGNPVSALVTYELLVRPALHRLAGRTDPAPVGSAVLSAGVRHRRGRTEAVRCRLTAGPDGWEAEPMGHQGSHVTSSLLGAHALALLPPGRDDLAAGERVRIVLRHEALT